MNKDVLGFLYDIEEEARHLVNKTEENSWDRVYLNDLLKAITTATNHFALKKIYDKNTRSQAV